MSEDFPTPDSPMTKILRLTRLSRALSREMLVIGLSRHLALHWGQLLILLLQVLQTVWPLLQITRGRWLPLLNNSKHTSQHNIDILRIIWSVFSQNSSSLVSKLAQLVNNFQSLCFYDQRAAHNFCCNKLIFCSTGIRFSVFTNFLFFHRT